MVIWLVEIETGSYMIDRRIERRVGVGGGGGLLPSGKSYLSVSCW